jgi:hypothetical protein
MDLYRLDHVCVSSKVFIKTFYETNDQTVGRRRFVTAGGASRRIIVQGRATASSGMFYAARMGNFGTIILVQYRPLATTVDSIRGISPAKLRLLAGCGKWADRRLSLAPDKEPASTALVTPFCLSKVWDMKGVPTLVPVIHAATKLQN